MNELPGESLIQETRPVNAASTLTETLRAQAASLMRQACEKAKPVLSVTESDRLTSLEATIERGLTTFVDVGNALLEIRDSKLYRRTHDTFEAYCRERWQMSRVHAHRLIDAAEVVTNLLPIGNIPSESVARPLASLKPVQQREVWTKAVKTAPNGKVTAMHVAKVKAEIIKPEPKTKKPFFIPASQQRIDNPVKADPQHTDESLEARTIRLIEETRKALQELRFSEVTLADAGKLKNVTIRLRDEARMMIEHIQNKSQSRN
jgi:hypothetical protein